MGEAARQNQHSPEACFDQPLFGSMAAPCRASVIPALCGIVETGLKAAVFRIDTQGEQLRTKPTFTMSAGMPVFAGRAATMCKGPDAP